MEYFSKFVYQKLSKDIFLVVTSIFLNLQYVYQIFWNFWATGEFFRIWPKKRWEPRFSLFSNYDAIHHMAKCNCYRQTCAFNLQFVILNCLWRFNSIETTTNSETAMLFITDEYLRTKILEKNKELLYTLKGLNKQSHQTL